MELSTSPFPEIGIFLRRILVLSVSNLAFPLLVHCLLTSLPPHLNCPSYWQGDPEQPTSLTVCSGLPLSPLLTLPPSISPCELGFSFFLCSSLSTSICLTLFSLLQGCPGFESTKFLVRYSGSNKLIDLVTSVVSLGGYPL